MTVCQPRRCAIWHARGTHSSCAMLPQGPRAARPPRIWQTPLRSSREHAPWSQVCTRTHDILRRVALYPATRREGRSALARTIQSSETRSPQNCACGEPGRCAWHSAAGCAQHAFMTRRCSSPCRQRRGSCVTRRPGPWLNAIANLFCTPPAPPPRPRRRSPLPAVSSRTATGRAVNILGYSCSLICICAC